MKKHGWLILVIGIIFGFTLAKTTGKITRKKVKAAQELLGIRFENETIATMLDYLNNNLKGYESMRKFPLDNSISPALIFDPIPNDVVIKKDEGLNPWKINEGAVLPDNPDELAFYPLLDLAGLIYTRKISATDLTKLYLNRIQKHDPKLLSFVTITEDLALQQAQKADDELSKGLYRGPLHGIPYGIKDLAAVPGYPTTWGAAPFQNQVIDEIATVAKKLEDAGAVLLGKLVSGSLARGDVWFGGKTKNPWDLDQGATGSSAGSGAATAAGLVAFSIGTETLGSIIAPSTRTGSTGLRPTFGAVSKHGFMVLSWSMDKVGPICRSAEDCALVFDYIRGVDPKDRTTKAAAFKPLNKLDITQLKVAYFHELFEKDSSSSGHNNQRTLDELKKIGINPIPISIPQNFPFEVFDIILRAESGAFFDELVRSGTVDQLEEQHEGSRANSLRQSRFIPAVEYLQANRHRTLLIQDFHDLIKEFDLVLSPTYAGNQLLMTNLTGHPALSLPNGFDDKGRPTSLTLIGNYFGEDKLVSLASIYQEAYKYHGLVPLSVK
ncbi:amidase [Cecembia rubra]|uniref:Asp-tRNA(Asn)/Glu-tRNA(Gln) amidotransferase A subunit family amidase n=1 Tax=Cecembia rubra TaxID=1485585 RepID=A0A2P8ECS9_9BACT|nr:amidase [Cecembia rubra]PSL07261.1 Asp-tRNA(Asn)/Glu-tRNA(Gln) amidotransferase A subunit family amidase [Cecembia rubra]